jgi:tetratricopeptide (TPR) repeat protein
VREKGGNYDAALILARLYYEQGNHDDALTMYNKALAMVLQTRNSEMITAIYEEMEEKKWVKGFSEKNIYSLARFYEELGQYERAVELYGIYIQVYRQGMVRPKAIYRAHMLFKDKLQDDNMARNALAFLHREYPGWMPH